MLTHGHGATDDAAFRFRPVLAIGIGALAKAAFVGIR